MEANKEFLAIACGELGYLEKSRKSWDLYGINCLFDKTKYAGADNVQKYAYETGHYTKYGWAAWCQSFVNWCMMAAFGADKANALLCGKYGSASTMEVKDAMVSAGRKVISPKHSLVTSYSVSGLAAVMSALSKDGRTASW